MLRLLLTWIPASVSVSRHQHAEGSGGVLVGSAYLDSVEFFIVADQGGRVVHPDGNTGVLAQGAGERVGQSVEAVPEPEGVGPEVLCSQEVGVFVYEDVIHQVKVGNSHDGVGDGQALGADEQVGKDAGAHALLPHVATSDAVYHAGHDLVHQPSRAPILGHQVVSYGHIKAPVGQLLQSLVGALQGAPYGGDGSDSVSEAGLEEQAEEPLEDPEGADWTLD